MRRQSGLIGEINSPSPVQFSADPTDFGCKTLSQQMVKSVRHLFGSFTPQQVAVDLQNESRIA
ncbi:MAG: hypothetical protein A3H31_01955 [Gallionellales bacterium RIFCSPLOWO2_02_FULL_57_47]|nr:MAG: hypothetical protein A3H31_01955 [Gallionellales bacterium RIFCSPLOWO2_02_FULL_57_47]